MITSFGLTSDIDHCVFIKRTSNRVHLGPIRIANNDSRHRYCGREETRRQAIETGNEDEGNVHVRKKARDCMSVAEDVQGDK